MTGPLRFFGERMTGLEPWQREGFDPKLNLYELLQSRFTEVIRPEAEAVVNELHRLTQDSAYADRSIGVIILRHGDQTQLVQNFVDQRSASMCRPVNDTGSWSAHPSSSRETSATSISCRWSSTEPTSSPQRWAWTWCWRNTSSECPACSYGASKSFPRKPPCSNAVCAAAAFDSG